MTIYTRNGLPIGLSSARIIPMWVEKRPGKVKFHYRKPDKIAKGATLEERPSWHYRGYYIDSSSPICDGKWVDAVLLVADDGWQEIEAKLNELCPGAREKFNAWNKQGAPDQEHYFQRIRPNEAA